ncbi:nucleotidyltransferase family protein [Paremcibacter congregatus]|uniref:nucleotidyltransferase family protein n=1 Tax=Paremcibacter congregatus TaxID=2043170 RepID=UPI0030EECD2B|tara:strand:+ start:7402 stop:8454 length:1053 start_codon:yes stop_codon:yes gene_type:complete
MTLSWTEVLITPMTSLHDALMLIDRTALRAAIVCEDNRKLCGIVTDGDIRRGILKQLPLSTPVSEVMNKSPQTSDLSTSRDVLIRMMEKKDCLVIPLVENGIVVGLETLHHCLSVEARENPVFLMAGGFGTRLRPLTDNCPKPLLRVGERPILEITLRHLIRHGFKNFYISTHYLPDMIRDYFGDGEKWDVSITYVYEDQPLGTGGALGLLPRNIPQLPLIMMNGDVLTNLNVSKLLEFHHKENASATMCVREIEYKIPYGVVDSANNLLIGMVEKPTHYFQINAGIYVINPEVYNSVDKHTVIDMPTLLEREITIGKIINIFPLHDYWLDIGRMEDFKRAQVDIQALDF